MGQQDAANALPQPPPTTPPGCWVGPRVSLAWTGVAQGNTNDTSTFRTAQWRSPIFDLQPQLGAMGGSEIVNQQGVTPIWKPGAQLMVLIHFANVTTNGVQCTFNDLNITAYDEAHPVSAAEMWQITAEQDVTTRFTSNNSQAQIKTGAQLDGVGVFSPPGPCRYWRFSLIFRFWLVHPDPKAELAAAVY